MGFLSTIVDWVWNTAIPWVGENILGITDSALSYAGQQQTNEVNQNIAFQNANAIKEANRENIAFQQRENLYARQREDNAITRASIDMQNAGLSKTLAAGHPASAQAMTAPVTQAPNYSYKYESALLKLQIADNIANYKLKMSEANKNNAQAITLGKQGTMYDSSTELNKSVTRLNQISGDYEAKRIETEISYQIQKIAESKNIMSLNNERIYQMSAEIAHTIAQTEKLSYEQQLLVYEITAQRLANLTSSWNLSRNMVYGTPTNYTPSAIGKLGRDFASGTFGKMGNDFYISGLDDIMVGNY